MLQLELGADQHLHARLSLRDGSIVTPRDLASALGVEPRHVVRTEIETELPDVSALRCVPQACAARALAANAVGEKGLPM